MARIQIRPGKFITISPALAEKAAALFADGKHEFTREQVAAMAKAEQRGATVSAGAIKPTAPANRRPSIAAVRFKR